MTDDETRARAAQQADANAALEGIQLAPPERDLVERRRRGEITQEEFLAAARELAERTVGGDSDR